MSVYPLLREARDARTPPARLSQLARLGAHHTPPGVAHMFEWEAFRPLLLDLIADNPNTDPDTLFLLLPDRPTAVLSNPAFELLLLETPAALLAQPRAVRLAVARCAEAPEAAILSLLGDAHDEVQDALAAHPHTPPASLRALAVSPRAPSRIAAARHPQLPPEWLALLIRAGSTAGLEGWSGQPGALTEDELRALLQAGEWGRSLVARHPQTPPSWFRRPGRGADDFCCALPGREPPASASGEAESPLVRHALATNPRLPGEMLARLATDPDPVVQEAVAANPSTAAAVLARLAERHLPPRWGSREAVLLRLARHQDTPPDSLRLIATCGQSAPAQAALDHPLLDPSWRALVIASGLHLSSEQQPERPLSGEEFLRLSSGGLRAQLFVATHPEAPLESLRWLADHAAEQVQAAVATHPRIDEGLRQAFVASGSILVRQSLAGATTLPAATLDALVENVRIKGGYPVIIKLLERADLTLAHCLALAPHSGVADRLLLNRATMPGLIEAFVMEGGRLLEALLTSPAAPPPLLSTHARSSDWKRRHSVGRNPITPATTLAQLARDEDPRVRAIVATNPSCPADSLSILVQDDVPHVRQVAQRRQKASERR